MNKIIKMVKENKLLIAVLLFASFLRLVLIDHTPPSLNWDEVSHGYNAYSILKTGKDEWGVVLPTIFRAYGDYKLPVYIYVTAISELFFGLNAFAVRLPSILAGIGTVLFTYLFVKELFRDLEKKVLNAHNLGLISALLVAVEPWSLFLSRGAFEANLSLFLVTAGAYYFVRGANGEVHHLFFAAILWGLSVWTYNSARIFVPLIIPFFILLYRIELAGHWLKDNIQTKAVFFVLMFFLGAMFVQLVSPAGQARYGKVAILDEGAIARIEESRNTSQLNPELSRILYNKGTFFVISFAINWASHFDGGFLFTEGGDQFQFSVPHLGLIYFINVFFFLAGVILLVKERSRAASIVLIWFFLGPVASSLTREAPHVLRSITMLPVPMIITGFGFLKAISFLSNKRHAYAILGIVVYVSLLLASEEYYMTNYFTNYRNTYSWSWQYGYKEMVSYVKDNYDSYDKIIITKKYGEPHTFILFFWPWNPAMYRNDPNLNRFEQTDWFWVDGFDKFYFVNDWQIVDENGRNYEFVQESKRKVDCSNSKCLLVTSPNNVPDGWKKLDTINFLDNKSAFELYEN